MAVVVKGSLRNHAVTDLQGRYSIRVPSSTDTLQFTYLGYKPLERVVGSRTRLDVEMLSESQQVDAVVVTALGLTRKEKSGLRRFDGRLRRPQQHRHEQLAQRDGREGGGSEFRHFVGRSRRIDSRDAARRGVVGL
ncbi:MAG: carboxypeptidase-like regulatory domain-containing protein [Alistipes communis]